MCSESSTLARDVQPCSMTARELAALHRANAIGAREAADHFEENADITRDRETAAELRGIAMGLRIAAADYLEALADELARLAATN